MSDLKKLAEPKLLFGHNQTMEDPRDGLTLFNPLDEGKVYGLRAGVIGSTEGIRRYNNWVKRIQLPIIDTDKFGNSLIHRPYFPGFEAAFRIPWQSRALEVVIPDGELEKYLYLDDRYNRVYKTVSVYTERILNSTRQEEAPVDIWFVIIPEAVWQKCRPRSVVEAALKIEEKEKRNPRDARKLQNAPSFFEEDNIAAIPYTYEVHFHNQLKARLLADKILTQIIRETTIAPEEFLDHFDRPSRQVDEPSAVAWNLTTAAFYKAGGRPWKINEIRDGVCYIGLAFKHDELNADPRSACCAAQMFLDSGDGIVFKGAVGPWHTPGRGDYHLSRDAAKQLIGIAVDSYRYHTGTAPRELFIHW